MKMLLLSGDGALAELLKRRCAERGFEFTAVEEPEAALAACAVSRPDFVAVSDRFFRPETLGEFADRLRSVTRARVAVMLSNRHDAAENAAMLKECLASSWQAVHPGRSAETVAAELISLMSGEAPNAGRRKNRIVLFFGSTPNIGVTVTAFGAAAHMARLSRRSVAYLCLNLKSSKIHRYLGCERTANPLDGLRAELKSNRLTAGRLKGYCLQMKKQPNLYVLPGNRQREQAEFYRIEDIECLLRAAAEAFDYCVADASAYWDNAATVGGILQAGQRILVTTPVLSNFQEDVNGWLKTLAPMLGLSDADFDLLIARQPASPPAGGFGKNEIRRETGLARIGTVRHTDGIDAMLDQGRLWDAVTGKGPLSNDLERVARTLLALHGDEPDRGKTSAGGWRWRFGLFGARRRMPRFAEE